MSFFQQKGDDSNLQYDDAAFLYFIASSILITAFITAFLFLRDLFSLRVKDAYVLSKNSIFLSKVKNLRQ
jgi:hypothetical protein